MQYTTNYKMMKPEYTDVADIEDLNANFDVIDNLIYTIFKRMNEKMAEAQKGNAAILIASYDTANPLKARANYTCTKDNASEVITEAIASLAPGGVVELMDGTYNLQYDFGSIVLGDYITIRGCGHKTVINQPTSDGEAKACFSITGKGVKVENMMICDSDIDSPEVLISLQSSDAIFRDLFFILNADHSKTNYCSCIKGAKNCNFTKIEDCRVYRSVSSDSNSSMFDFVGCTAFSGVICANISSGYGGISINFDNQGQIDNTALYGNTNLTKSIKGAIV